ncbi:unnamed protein product [Pleuronectes platessa]|uniref:G-protein coupled receptors family 2 profile 2 domain-containing protein n=1 Tax=Pleuronectes platessa TaxID=8262 RepID=A0A9N7Y765_PLEPL|nr:unnamed protein product [Pleuronectes platessa]
MASFSWMLVEGLLLWSKVVSVNISEDRRMKLYYIIGWGLPVLIVGVTLAVSVDKYKADDHCWLNVKTDTIWAFVGPVIFVLAVNAVVLCRVVMVTVSSAHRRAKMLSPSSASKLQTFDLTWAVTRPVLILLPVLGLTWLCGVLVHLSVVVAYVFIALNAFQGQDNPSKTWGRDTAGGPPPPRQRRVPLTGAVAEVIREKSPTHVQSRCRRPSYPVPSNRSPPSAAPTDTAPRHTIRKAPAPRTSTSPHKKTSRSAAHRASGGVVRRATGRLLPQPQDVPSGLTTNTEIGLYIFLVYAVYNSEVRNAIKRIKEKRKALSFTNCSQPTSFLPSQRAPITSWCRSQPAPSSPETSETSGPPSSTSTSLVIKNDGLVAGNSQSYATLGNRY